MKELSLFIKMIKYGIPQSCFESINADVVAKIEADRQLSWIGRSTDILGD